MWKILFPEKCVQFCRAILACSRPPPCGLHWFHVRSKPDSIFQRVDRSSYMIPKSVVVMRMMIMQALYRNIQSLTVVMTHLMCRRCMYIIHGDYPVSNTPSVWIHHSSALLQDTISWLPSLWVRCLIPSIISMAQLNISQDFFYHLCNKAMHLTQSSHTV